MGRYQRSIYSRFVLFIGVVIVVFLNSCRPSSDSSEVEAKVSEVVELSKGMVDTRGGIAAMRFLDSAIGGTELALKSRFAVYLQKYDIAHGSMGDDILASRYADSMLLLLVEDKKVFDTGEIFKAYLLKANISYASERFDEAFLYYDKARALALASKQPCSEYIFLYRIGMSHFKEEKFMEAAGLFQASHKKIMLCSVSSAENDLRHQEILSNIGLAFMGGGKPDSSIPFFHAAIDLIDRKRTVHFQLAKQWDEARSVAMGNLGEAYFRLSKFDSAEWYFLGSIRLNKLCGRNIQDRLYNELKLGDLYVQVGRFDEAERILGVVDEEMAARQTSFRVGDGLELELRRAKVCVHFYRATADVASAFKMQIKYDSLREQKWIFTNKILNNSVDRGLDNAQNERQIVLLEKDMQIRGQQNVILILATFILLLVTVVIFRSMKAYRERSVRFKKQAEDISTSSARTQEQLQKRIREDELNFMSLIENTDDVLWSVDKMNRLLAFNRAFREMVSRDTDAFPLVGNRFPALSSSSVLMTRIEEGYSSVAVTGQFELIDKLSDVTGASKHIQLRFKPILNEVGDVAGVSCFLRDITEYVWMIESLEEKNKQLKDIAWVQSHKLRGPLTSVMGILAFLEDDDASAELQMEMRRTLAEKVAEMDAIIHEIVAKTK
jgi:tetratricopeptide (TPR) repeat protein